MGLKVPNTKGSKGMSFVKPPKKPMLEGMSDEVRKRYCISTEEHMQRRENADMKKSAAMMAANFAALSQRFSMGTIDSAAGGSQGCTTVAFHSRSRSTSSPAYF
jgi:hypothetical protein